MRDTPNLQTESSSEDSGFSRGKSAVLQSKVRKLFGNIHSHIDTLLNTRMAQFRG